MEFLSPAPTPITISTPSRFTPPPAIFPKAQLSPRPPTHTHLAMSYSVYCTLGLYTPPRAGPRKASSSPCLAAA